MRAVAGLCALALAVLGVTPERAKQVLFSHPYVGMDNVVIGDRTLVLHGVADLAEHRVSVPQSSTQEVALVRQESPDIRISHFDDQATPLQALVTSQVDAFASPVMIVGQIDAALPGIYEVKFSLFVRKNALAMRLGQTELVGAVGQCLADGLAQGRLPALYTKWFRRDMPPL